MRYPTAFQMKTGPFDKKARGESKTHDSDRMNAIQFWITHSRSRMRGSGETSQDTNHY